HYMYRDVVDVVEQAGHRLDVLLVPKVGVPADVYLVDALLTQIETARGIPTPIGIEILIETALGLANVESIAQASRRLEAMHFGVADLAASLRPPTRGRSRASTTHPARAGRGGAARTRCRATRWPDDRRGVGAHGPEHRRDRGRHRRPRQPLPTPGRHPGVTMDIHEYQAKELLTGFGVRVPKGGVAYSADQAVYRAAEIGGNGWVVKAQIHSGARGKAGGIKLCATDVDVRQAAKELLGKSLVTTQTGP